MESRIMQKKEDSLKICPAVFVVSPDIRVTLGNNKTHEKSNAAYIQALNEKGFWLGYYQDINAELWIIQGKILQVTFEK